MGFRSTGVLRELAWEDTTTYVPPLIYVFAQNRGGILGSLKRIFGRAENQ